MSSVADIPWYGELITARWAFEALTVHQFSKNEYQKEFFVYEKLKSNATYRKDYWIPAIKGELTKFSKSNDIEEKLHITKLVTNEITNLKNYIPQSKHSIFPDIQDIDTLNAKNIQSINTCLDNIITKA
jgi:hypothetical protein